MTRQLQAAAPQAQSTPVRVGLLQRACACGQHAEGGECEACRRKREGTLQRAAISDDAGGAVAPPIVHEVLNSPGQPLDTATRAFMEPRFGHDFSSVRVHTDSHAAQSARAVNALAYTVGSHVAFDTGQFRPGSSDGRRLLAHELAHVVQQAGDGLSLTDPLPITSSSGLAEHEAQAAAQGIGNPRPRRHRTALQRFERSERSKIGSFVDVLDTAKAIAERSERNGQVDASTFVQQAGGFSIRGKIGGAVGSESDRSPLPYRYLVTCRCGLLDMRHFYQLMYVTRAQKILLVSQGVRDEAALNDLANRGATQAGRDWELEHEPQSRFSAEDTPSNALGALFGTDIGIWSSPKAFLDKLRAYLTKCGPVDFAGLPATEQTAIVDFYGDRTASKRPTNTNETAIPAVLGIAACGVDRAMPFGLDVGDPDRKTLTKAPFNLSGDNEIRDWVRKNSDDVIRALPVAEKIRLINRLLDYWVSDDDMTTIERICGIVTSADEMRQINKAIHPREGDLNNAEQQKRLHNIVQRVP